MFPPVDKDKSFPQREVDILRFWKEHDTYHKTLRAREGAEPFVFYEGPPTANGMPHPGHCLTRAIKDLFPRYKTMRGYRCERKAGWDTHGLPVETEVCKELGIHAKEEIEAYGVERFIHRCQASVWRYMSEWERLTERIGFWVDLKNAYVTYHQSYVESVWWSLKQFFDRGLLYQGHKIVWWWAQGGTALSAGEVGQGYREVADPSVYVKFPLIFDDRTRAIAETCGWNDNTSLLVWTTTPWTLPSNHYVAVNKELTYVTLEDSSDGSRIVVAEALRPTIEAKTKREFVECAAYSGAYLQEARYQPPFDIYFTQFGSETRRIDKSLPVFNYAAKHFIETNVVGTGSNYDRVIRERFDEWHSKNSTQPIGWQVLAAEFVSTEAGTGLVHIAPAFGEDDMKLLEEQRQLFAETNTPPILNSVAPDGKFTEEAPEYLRGRWVKDCDKDIVRDLKQRGLLFHQEQYLHDYPFCWRAEQDPLIQYPRESWFIRTTAFKEAMLENNSHINWLPEHIKEGRFGKFLESNVDWALSRERFWGTPLPIWVCEQTGEKEAISSYAELQAKPGFTGGQAWTAAKEKNPELPDDLRVHKPYIDAVTYDSPFANGARMKRVPDVIDVWYDSGAMPFAQWGYRGEESVKDSSGSLPLAGRAGEGVEAGTRAAKVKSSEGSSPLPNPPHQGEGTGGSLVGAAQKFRSQFPADFISEAIDQTRGWFYSQLAISTMLWGDTDAAPGSARGSASIGTDVAPTQRDPRPEAGAASEDATFPYPHPFKTCIVLGLMLGEDGQKMSKQKRNYREPREIFDRYGADALRWYFFANQPPWTSIRYSEQAIKDSVPEFLLRLWNVYSFFTIYANIDGFTPVAAGQRPAGAPPKRGLPERSELDRWILSELNRTAAIIVDRMDAYDNFAACAAITGFVDALSNWYVRRSRDRFWAADRESPEKLDAYWTLYECLTTTAKIIAPFTPFLAESLWRNLAVGPYTREGEAPAEPAQQELRPPADIPESVHLCDFPTGDASAIDEQLSERMNLVRHIASLGRQARTAAALKVRQPLAKVEVILADRTHQPWLEEHAAVIAEELNVKAVEFSDAPDKYVHYEVLPNFKALGKKLGKLMPKVKPELAKRDGAKLLAEMRDSGLIKLTLDGEDIELTEEEVEIRLQAKPGWAAANEKGVVVVLATELTPELIEEGLARDLVRAIQDRRKEIGCDFTDRIHVGVVTSDATLQAAVRNHRGYIMAETLADSLTTEKLPGIESASIKAGDAAAELYLQVSK